MLALSPNSSDEEEGNESSTDEDNRTRAASEEEHPVFDRIIIQDNDSTTESPGQVAPEQEVPQSPTWLHLLSYQRSGSTFTARVLDADPDSFYVFEPLDMTYVAMYATAPAINSPDNIFFNKDGSER